MKINYFLTFFSILLSLAIADCRCSRSQIVINKVIVEMPEGIPQLHSKESQEELRMMIRNAVAQNPSFYFDMKAKNASLLRLSCIPEGRHRENFLLQALLVTKIDGVEQEQMAFAAVNLQDGLKSEAVKSALQEALHNLGKLASAKAIDKEGLQKRLQESLQKKVPPAELINTIALLAKAKDTASAPYFMRILETTDDLTVVNACLLALGEIADQASMEAIIAFAERKPPYIRRQAIFAARKVASPLAMQWLLVMAYGHEDGVVRAEALEAFLEVEAKQASLP